MQNTLGVEDVCVTDPEFVGRQIKAVVEDVSIGGIKLGELRFMPAFLLTGRKASVALAGDGEKSMQRNQSLIIGGLVGMLASKQTVEVVARELQDIQSKGAYHVVLDPVRMSLLPLSKICSEAGQGHGLNFSAPTTTP